MIKTDEIAFYDFARTARAQGEMLRDIINRPDCPVPHKRAWYLLSKWNARGWYEYGVTLDLGFFTAAAPAALGEQA